jgi:putative ABC transport system ATP-binding protein
MIEIDKLQFRYADTGFRLNIPRLSIERGEKVAIVGASGSGKTTLLNLLAGVQVAERGSIYAAGHRVDSLTDAARRRFRIANIGFVFQEFELLQYLTVRENILLPYLINRHMKPNAEVRDAANGLAASMGMADKMARTPQRLSQGERQRVAICRAMIARPKIVLADEATGSLDPNMADKMLDLLLSTVEQQGTTLLFVTHDHRLLSRFDRTIDFADFHLASAGEGVE